MYLVTKFLKNNNIRSIRQLGGCALLLLLPFKMMAEEADTIQQSKIKELAFLVGDWAGNGKSFDKKGNESPYYDTESVWFDVQESVLIIQAKGFRNNKQFYGIHTVIYYDEDAEHYWYNPFTAKGARPFSCVLSGQIFVCLTKSKTFRLTFKRTADGQWNEFGEQLTNGLWNKTFETLLEEVE